MKQLRGTRGISLFLVTLMVMMLWPQQKQAWAGDPNERPSDEVNIVMGRSIAVIDFSNDTGDKKLDHLKKGLSESLITKLAAYPGLKIVERGKLDAAMKELGFGQTLYADSSSAAQIGKIVGANTIVSGSLVKAGGRFEMNVRVFDVATSRILISEGYGFQSETETLDVVKYLSMRIPHEFGLKVDLDTYAKTKQLLDSRMSGGTVGNGDTNWVLWAVIGGVAVVGIVVAVVVAGRPTQTVSQNVTTGSGSNPAADALKGTPGPEFNLPLLHF